MSIIQSAHIHSIIPAELQRAPDDGAAVVRHGILADEVDGGLLAAAVAGAAPTGLVWGMLEGLRRWLDEEG